MFDRPKLKAFADDKRNLTKKLKLVLISVENIMGKGVNAGYRHFLLSHNVFKSLLIQGRLKLGLCGKELRCILTHYHKMPHFDTLIIYSCGKHCKKGEIACNKQFLLFSQCFLPFRVLIFHFKCTLKCRLQFVSIWTSLKFCCLQWVNIDKILCKSTKNIVQVTIFTVLSVQALVSDRKMNLKLISL